MSWLGAFGDFLSSLTATEGVLLILVILFYRRTVTSHRERIHDRQKEIDRVAKENREYRDRFTHILDLEPKMKFKDQIPENERTEEEKK